MGIPYREGLVKNRYVGRTFLMPDQRIRELSVRRKLNAMESVLKDKNILLIDDSIVRGTTMRQIVDMCRRAGAAKVYLERKIDECQYLMECTSPMTSMSHTWTTFRYDYYSTMYACILTCCH